MRDSSFFPSASEIDCEPEMERDVQEEDPVLGRDDSELTLERRVRND